MSQEEEQRFAHLLKPIRDLAENWNVDVATELEEYLDELESVTISLDGNTLLNFAEAALLIQGSTCIYSKKVEYLYALVFQTLEHVTEQKKAKAAQAADQELGGEEDDLLVDEEENFLVLDDIEEGRNIDLDDDASAFDGGLLAGKGAAPATPNVLMLSGIFGSDLGESFRVNSCAVHKSGALLMEGVAHTSLDGNLQSTLGAGSGVQLDFGGDDFAPDFSDDEAPPEFDDGGYDGPQMPPMQMEMMLSPPAAGGASASASMSRSRSREMTAVWAPLDPHSSDAPKPKALRVARTFAVPAELLEEGAKPSKASLGKKAKKQPPTTLEAIHAPASVPLTGLACPEFSYILRHQKKVQLKRRLAAKRATAAAASMMAPAEASAYDDDDEDDNEPFGFQNLDDFAPEHDDDDDGPPEFDDDMPFDLPPVSPVRPLALEDAFDDAPRTYEDLCRQHVAEFMRGAEVYAQETQLSRRVAAWQARLAPVLAAQEERDAFDIHSYGDRIIAQLEEEPAAASGKSRKRQASGADKSLGFEALLPGADCFEVARFFLASLQLANTGAVTLSHSWGQESEDLSLKLNAGVSRHADLGDYLAPSLLESQSTQQQQASQMSQMSQMQAPAQSMEVVAQ